MRELSAAELLEIWEHGSTQTPAERALTVLASADRSLQGDALAAMSVGRRDGLLLSLRQSVFGQELAALATCPECQEQLELVFDARDLCSSSTEVVDEARSFTLATDDYEIVFRLPDSRDLAAAASTREVESARKLLLERCVLSACRQSADVAIELLPSEVLETIEQEMAARDAQANIQIALQCPSCPNAWTSPFDILSFFWTELDAWAQRILVEVHELAIAYGWSESEILKLSAARRNLYLNMVGG